MQTLLKVFLATITAFFVLATEGYAQNLLGGGGVFQSKLGNLRDVLIGTILPLISTIGLVYAAILSMTGSGEGRSKVISIIAMSVIGFMAKYIIQFFQNIAG